MPNRPLCVLVADDEAAMRMVLDMRLRDWGYETLLAADGEEAERLAQKCHPDIVVSDVVMPGLGGLELLRSLKKGDPARAVILITAQGTIDMAVEAMKQGALDFITKPLDHNKLKAVLEAAQQDILLRRQSRRISTQLDRRSGFGPFVGTSAKMREVYQMLETLAHSDASALLSGESGTGKELAARAIHSHSGRSKGPFIAVNAAAIPETLMESEMFGHEKGAFTGAVATRPGCFELAHRGTLLLDEIAEMPAGLQPKLLRVLEDGRVRRLGAAQEFAYDVRVLAATNRDPREAVEKGQLREDLLYRLNVFHVVLPPLRDRKDDLPGLVQHFLNELNAKHHSSVVALRPEALERLQAYRWPGNVRELRNVLERAVILAKGEWIESSHLPPYLRTDEDRQGSQIVVPPGATAAETERELILKTLQQTGNNKAETARRLGLDVKTIRNKLKSYGISS
ncbi:MAG: sigma-54-dependent Fis family transcriptional regulator [Acidobacteria bacterium]|nr:sigma-54-dependent Fis family transcriptional regulator [Acidobacteriota bacterium]